MGRSPRGLELEEKEVAGSSALPPARLAALTTAPAGCHCLRAFVDHKKALALLVVPGGASGPAAVRDAPHRSDAPLTFWRTPPERERHVEDADSDVVFCSFDLRAEVHTGQPLEGTPENMSHHPWVCQGAIGCGFQSTHPDHEPLTILLAPGCGLGAFQSP
jgi:hypothetical protein